MVRICSLAGSHSVAFASHHGTAWQLNVAVGAVPGSREAWPRSGCSRRRQSDFERPTHSLRTRYRSLDASPWDTMAISPGRCQAPLVEWHGENVLLSWKTASPQSSQAWRWAKARRRFIRGHVIRSFSAWIPSSSGSGEAPVVGSHIERGHALYGEYLPRDHPQGSLPGAQRGMFAVLRSIQEEVPPKSS